MFTVYTLGACERSVSSLQNLKAEDVWPPSKVSAAHVQILAPTSGPDVLHVIRCYRERSSFSGEYWRRVAGAGLSFYIKNQKRKRAGYWKS